MNLNRLSKIAGQFLRYATRSDAINRFIRDYTAAGISYLPDPTYIGQDDFDLTIYDVYSFEEDGVQFKVLEVKQKASEDPDDESPDDPKIGDITYSVGDYIAKARLKDGKVNFGAFEHMWEIFQEEIARKKAKQQKDSNTDYYGFDDMEFIRQLNDDDNDSGNVEITLSTGKVYKDSFFRDRNEAAKTGTAGYYNHFGNFIGDPEDILKDLKDSGELKITLDRLNKEDK